VRALLSVSDKTGLTRFGRYLYEQGFALTATGGTARALADAGLPVTDVDALTGVPPLLGGRVKTLHPAIHAGILARDRAEDQQELAQYGWAPFDVVVANLYPFRQAVQQGASEAELVEEIDIGGVTLLRAAAKNWARVAVFSDPEQYAEAMDRGPDAWDVAYRRRLAAYAFRLVAQYDAEIADAVTGLTGERWPERWTLTGTRHGQLRYGENPHQEAQLYVTPRGGGLPAAEILQGKALSYNNWLDAEAAWRLAWDLPGPGAAAVKHQMPCGAALGEPAATAFARTREADPVSIFGGIVAFNQPVDGAAAKALTRLFLEVVVAPAFDADARAVLARRAQLRVLAVGAPPGPGVVVRSLTGGWLVQDEDRRMTPPERWSCQAGDPAWLRERWEDIDLAWRVVQHARSNAVVLVRDGMTVGIGQGQTNRVDAVRHAVSQAGERARGAVLASDAFFFPDSVEVLAQAGVLLAVSPGGSVRDAEVVEACQTAGLGLWFTGERHFRH
jgi:phosphoribosylaminoimidazolecarboxamide formyltransferase/IMP cyclohydrolase